MDFLGWYWSDLDSGGKVKYLTSIMCGHTKAQDVVTGMLTTLEELAIPHTLMLFHGMDEPKC